MINVVGIGLCREAMTYEAMETIRQSDVIAGYKTYIDLVKV